MFTYDKKECPRFLICASVYSSIVKEIVVIKPSRTSLFYYIGIREEIFGFFGVAELCTSEFTTTVSCLSTAVACPVPRLSVFGSFYLAMFPATASCLLSC